VTDDQVHAAGGVVWRRTPRGLEVVVVHRPAYDDWSFAKGKRDGDETDSETALREVEEETGASCVLGPELLSTTYPDQQGRVKVVRYWAMTVRNGEVRGCNEVDRAEWLPVAKARTTLTHPRDVVVLDSLLELLGEASS
jgi:8-oxo-dGTP pyrophosphatase MutT (NUDIX family)